jgi:hypothetical protein
MTGSSLGLKDVELLGAGPGPDTMIGGIGGDGDEVRKLRSHNSRQLFCQFHMLALMYVNIKKRDKSTKIIKAGMGC